MGEIADVKRRRIVRFLKWLHKQQGFTVENGGRHQIIIRHDSWERPYPIPFKHNRVSKVIVKAMIKQIAKIGQFKKSDLVKHLK